MPVMMQRDLELARADGNDLLNWFVSGAKEVFREVRYLNHINIFPVADGDTGSNLAATLRAMVDRPIPRVGFGMMFTEISLSGMSGACGNSGVIFASYINGAATECRDYERVNVREFAQIMHRAVSALYRSIENPMEGTMISVIREWADYLVQSCAKHDNFRDLFRDAFQAAAVSLEKTKTILAVLRRNNVVDSGAAGFVRFLHGINRFFSYDDADDLPVTAGLPVLIADLPQFRFCVEATLERVPESVEVTDVLAAKVRAALRTLGDSMIVTGSARTLKVHIHTNEPEVVMERLCDFGKITFQKADDMRLQNSLNGGAVRDIGLVTDSAADIPEEFLQTHQVAVIPLGIMAGGQVFLDKRTIRLKQTFEAMEVPGSYPTTTLPDPERVTKTLTDMLDRFDSLIILSVSGQLSGTYRLFLQAAKQANTMGKPVTVMDTHLNSGAQGLMVMRAAEMIAMGLAHEQIVANIRTLIPRARIYVCLNTLLYAVRGGRVPNTIGKIGMKLGVRPVMTLSREGKGAAFGFAFSRKGITRKIFRIIRKTVIKKGILAYSIVHGDNMPLASVYREQLTRMIGKPPAFVSEISSVIAIHSGPGTVAVSLIEGREETA
jgi:uncharacterized protein